MAKKIAQDEMFERDAFLRHWYTQTPFLKILANKKNLEQIERLNKLDLDIILAQSFMGYQKVICAFLVDKKWGGFALGLSSGRDNEDEDKAIFESLINYFFGHGGKSVDLLKKELNDSGINSLEKHRSYWLYDQKFPEFMIQTGVHLIPAKSSLIETDTQYYTFRDDSLKIVKMINKNLIELTVGDVNKSKHILTEIKKNDLLGAFKYHPIP